MKSILALLSLVLAPVAHATCSVAVMFVGLDVRPEMAAKLTTGLKQAVGKKNSVSVVTTAFEASRSDYFYILSQTRRGFRTSVNDILINNTFYTNEYLNSGFKSANEVIKTLVNDFTADALPEMEYCKK